MKPVIAALLMLAGRAGAQHCDVAIVRAPDDARAVVENWVAQEECAVPLEVRIVAVDKGLYVIALDARHRVRERVVPDAQTAGVLIASWAADDSLPTQALSVELSYTPAIAPPSTIAMTAPAIPPRAAPIRTGKTYAIAATALVEHDAENGVGVRGELDLAADQRLRVGTALSLSRARYYFFRPRDSGDLTIVDAKATMYVAHAARFRAVQLRTSIGVGLVSSYVTGVLYDMADPSFGSYDHPNKLGVFPTAEAAFGLGLQAGDRWFVETGPALSWLGQAMTIETPLMSGPSHLPVRGWEVSWFVGVRHTL